MSFTSIVVDGCNKGGDVFTPEENTKKIQDYGDESRGGCMIQLHQPEIEGKRRG